MGLKHVSRRRTDALTRVGWDQLESLLAAWYRSEGYEVEHVGTGASGAQYDGGIDLKLRRGEQFIIVQCKHWNAMKVPHNAVHELLGLMVNHGATGAILASSGEFTKAAIEAAQKLGHVQLIDGDELRMMLGPIREPATAFDAVRMGAADGGDSAVARRVGERLLSAGDDDGRGQSTAPRRALSVALIVLASVLFLAFVLLMAQYLMGRSLTGPSRATALPPPSPPATSIAPVSTAPQTPEAAQPDPCREIIDARTGSYIDHCVPGTAQRPATRTSEEQKRRAKEAMDVIQESTPEL